MNKKKWLLLLVCVLLLAACKSPVENNDSTYSEAIEEKNTEKNNAEEKKTEAEIEKIETYVIETAYTSIIYPVRWKDMLRTENTESGMAFYGKINDHEEKVLFTLEFGESDGYLLGTLDDTNIYIVDSEPEFDESWNQEEQNTIYAMKEDVNVILQGLLELDNFTLAQ